MSSYAYYRMPHKDEYVFVEQTEGKPAEMSSVSELNGRSGFVFAPFAPSEDCPVLLIRADRTEKNVVERIDMEYIGSATSTLTDREQYSVDFKKFHSHLSKGDFLKIVLSRCSCEKNICKMSAEELFMRACNLYPRMFIALVHTERSGTWLMATPEILLEGKNNKWRTIALAGTMRLSGKQLDFDNPPKENNGQAENRNSATPEWSAKNIEEQRLVADYVRECIEKFTDDFSETRTYNVRAGDLFHLRSDLCFTSDKEDKLGDVINSLHPTPAVCGIPKLKALDFIVNNESEARGYYSGFTGLLRMDGETHLYVSLRCMRIEADRCFLYAGGGLLRDSNEQQEWDETEAKMETMRRCMRMSRS